MLKLTMSCQGPDGLKVICRLPELVNVFLLLANNIHEIEKSNVFGDNPEYIEAFHVMHTLAKRISAKMNNLSIRLNKYRTYLIELIDQKATNKTRPLLLQKVTQVLKDLRQEMSRFVPKSKIEKRRGRQISNQTAVQNILNAQKLREANLTDTSRSEDAIYRSSMTAEELRDPADKLDEASEDHIQSIRELFQNLHIIGRAEPSLTKLEQDISDFLTEILLLFQEEIVELKMLIRMCQSSMGGSEKDKDIRVLNALNAVRAKIGSEVPDDNFEPQQTDCDTSGLSWYQITLELMNKDPIIV